MKRKVRRAAGFLTILLWAAALAADRFWGPLPDRTLRMAGILMLAAVFVLVFTTVRGASPK